MSLSPWRKSKLTDGLRAQIKIFIDLSPTFVSLKDPIGPEVISEGGPSV